MDLQDWHNRLQVHFTGLHAKRSAESGNHQLFALEHGLEKNEITSLSADIRSCIKSRRPSKSSYLPWIIYAAEIGYRYSGDQYWQTFEDLTPGWTTNGDRECIREFFWTFHKTFGAAKPSGPWASHFTIICWPITHAILPLDLQRQLAKALFDIRHYFSSRTLESPEKLGELIASRSWGASSRFRQFTQEHLLVGQIAVALLLHGKEQASSLLLPSTLNRIAEDLELERYAKTWIRGARDSFKWTVATPKLSPSGREEIQQLQSKEVTILEHELALRSSSENDWEIYLRIPDFSRLLLRFPHLEKLLMTSRCTVAGSNGRPLARGRLLYGEQLIKLETWPQTNAPILAFEAAPVEYNHLINAVCTLSIGKPAIFKLGADGVGRLLRTPSVRPGENYIITSSSPFLDTSPPFFKANISCSGIHAVGIAIPKVVNQRLSDDLKKLGLSQQCMVSILPVGLPPAKWDGAGFAEWLVTDKPCISAVVDHNVSSLLVSLDNEFLEITNPEPGNPYFIELSNLSIGLHKLQILPKQGGAPASTGSGSFTISIREPKQWNPATNTQSPLFATIDPIRPTLEDMWEGKVDLELVGQQQRQVEVLLEFYKKGETSPYFRKILPQLYLPVDRFAWHQHFRKHIEDDRNTENAYDMCSKLRITFKSGDVSGFSISLEREFVPLRWVLNSSSKAKFLRLQNDTDKPNPVIVQKYSFSNPDTPIPCNPQDFLEGKGISVSNGLYQATCGDTGCSIILPPEVHSFADLQMHPQTNPQLPSTDNVIKLLRLYSLWSEARLTGSFFSITAKKKVLETLSFDLFRLICGQKWISVERLIIEGKRPINDILKSAPSTPLGPILGSVILRSIGSLNRISPRECVISLNALATKHCGIKDAGYCEERHRVGSTMVIKRTVPDGPGNARWLCEFSLRLASHPQSVIPWAGEHLPQALKTICSKPTLACCARLMTLIISQQTTYTSPNNLTWDWQ